MNKLIKYTLIALLIYLSPGIYQGLTQAYGEDTNRSY